MAHATHLTITTCDRIRLDAGSDDYDEDRNGNEVSQEVQVSVTYALDPGDANVVVLAERKALEVKLAHEAVWNRIGAFSHAAFSSGASSSGVDALLAKLGDRTNGSGSPGRHEQSKATDETDRVEDAEDRDLDEAKDADEAPLAGLPHHCGDPFCGCPASSGAARPFPASGSGDPGTQNGNGRPDNVNPDNVSGRHDPVIDPDMEPATGPQKILIRSRAKKVGLTPYALERLLHEQFKAWKVERLTKAQAASLLDALERDLMERDLNEKDNGSKVSPLAAGGDYAA